MAEVKNYTGMKNATAVKAQVRIDVMDIIVNALIAEYGEDAVKKVGANEYAVIAGIIDDKYGVPQNICATVKPTVKEWEARQTTKKTFEKYDIAEEASAYEIEEETKRKKNEEKEKQKAEKIAKDKAERAKKA